MQFWYLSLRVFSFKKSAVQILLLFQKKIKNKKKIKRENFKSYHFHQQLFAEGKVNREIKIPLRQTANVRFPLHVSRDLRDIFLFKFHVNVKDGDRLRCKQFNISSLSRTFFFHFVYKLTVNRLFCIEYEIKQH